MVASNSLTEKTQKFIEEYIRNNNLREGDSLPSEGDFVDITGSSRVTVREAFKGLAAIGIIKVGNGRRAQVARVNSDIFAQIVDHAVYLNQASLKDIYDLRRTLEARTAELAAHNRTVNQAKEISETVKKMRLYVHDPKQVLKLDLQFHELIALASGNPVMQMVLQSFSSVTEQTWPVGWRSREMNNQQSISFDIHEAIADAISLGNSRAAVEAMKVHFDNSIENLKIAGLV